MFNFFKNNQKNTKEELKKILTSLKDVDDQSIQGISARYEDSLKDLLEKEFKNHKLDFKEYEKMENDMKSIYNDSKLDQKEKWTLLSKMKKNPEYQKFIEVKKDINNLSNSLFRENPELIEYRDNFISIIARHKDLMFFNDNNNILYRSVRASNEQELKAMFENGIYPQVLALDVYQTPTNLPYVNDAAIEKNIEQVGFTVFKFCRFLFIIFCE
jgi:hypothetical protein